MNSKDRWARYEELCKPEKHLKAVIQAIGVVKGWKLCNCREAFERDCRRAGCTPAQMAATEIIAGYVKVEDIK